MFRKTFVIIALAWLSACTTVATPPPPTRGFTTEQQTVLRANGFEQKGEGWEFGMADRFLFATDDSDLMAAQKDTLARTAAALSSVGITGARIEGHTDNTGTAAYNDALSLRRATAVAAALTTGGMNKDRLTVQGLGSRFPIASNTTADQRRENRRVVIIVAPEPTS